MPAIVEAADRERRCRRIRWAAVIATVAIPLAGAMSPSLAEEGGTPKDAPQKIEGAPKNGDGLLNDQDPVDVIVEKGELTLKLKKARTKEDKAKTKDKAATGATDNGDPAKDCLERADSTACQKLVDACTSKNPVKGDPDQCFRDDAKCVIACGTRKMIALQAKPRATARQQEGADQDAGPRGAAQRAAGEAAPQSTGASITTGPSVKAQAPRRVPTRQEELEAGNRSALRKLQEFLQYQRLQEKGIYD